ncbi:MAG: hypothetical protein ACRDTC_15805 [Pseudonocardiaceae bacterium]
MAGAHRSASPPAGRPAARILGALFAGSAVMFAVAAVPNGSPAAPEGGAEVIAGPRPGESFILPSPETMVASQGGAPSTAGDDAEPVIAVQSDWTATRPSPTRVETPEVAAVPDAPTGRSGRRAPGTTTDWETALRQALAQQASTQAAPAPQPSVPAAQNPPSAGEDDRSDNGVIEDLLGHLGAGL